MDVKNIKKISGMLYIIANGEQTTLRDRCLSEKSFGEDEGEYDYYRRQYLQCYVGRCYNCMAPRAPTESPKRCAGCQLVAYCSIDCQKDNWPIHKYICKEFPVVNGNNALHIVGSWEEHIADLQMRVAQLPVPVTNNDPRDIFVDPWVCHTCREPRPERLRDCKCSCVCYCSKYCANADKMHKEGCSYFMRIAHNYSLTYIQLSYPLSLVYALQLLPEYSPMKKLTVHVITNNPTFDSEGWELGLMHHYPRILHLEVVYVTQTNAFEVSLKQSRFSLPLCGDCKDKYRNLTSSFQKMQYHMFFSSLEYTEPDVVVVYGNKHEMLEHTENNIHSEMSYRNMTHSQSTILVLMDATMDLVMQGVDAVKNARNVDVLVPPKINRARAFSSTRAKLEFGVEVINEKYYFTCLRRK